MRTIAPLLLLAVGLVACTHAVGHDGPDGPAPVDAAAPADTQPPDAGPWAASNDICPSYPPATCVGAACATSDLAAHYLELWWQSKLEAIDATPTEIASIVEVSEATIIEGPLYVFFKVVYIARVDWVSHAGSETFMLGDYPLNPWPDDSTVMNILRQPPPCPHLPQVILSFDEVGERVRTCWPTGVATYCKIRTTLQAGNPALCTITAEFKNEVNIAKNECYEALINLESGDLEYCGPAACWVY